MQISPDSRKNTQDQFKEAYESSVEYESSDSDSVQKTASQALLVFHQMAEHGDVNKFSQMLEKIKARGLKLLEGKPEPIQQMIIKERLNQLLKIKDMYGRLPIHVAIMKGKIEILELLLRMEAPLETQQVKIYHLVVCMAGTKKNNLICIEMMERLLSHNIDFNHKDYLGRHILHWISIYDLCPMANIIIRKHQQQPNPGSPRAGKNIEQPSILLQQDNNGETPLHLACRYGSSNIVEILVKQEKELLKQIINSKNKSGNIPLHHACSQKHSDIAVRLLKLDLDSLNVKNKFGQIPLELAKIRGHTDLVKQLEQVSKEKLPSTPRTPSKAKNNNGHQNQKPQPTQIQQQITLPEDQFQTLVIAPNDCSLHLTSKNPNDLTPNSIPPENILRLKVLNDPDYGIFNSTQFQRKLQIKTEAKPVCMTDLLRVHGWNYVLQIQKLCASCSEDINQINTTANIDSDTSLSRQSYKAALIAAGAVIEGVDKLVNKQARNVFCAIRPPGHHAGPLGKVVGDYTPFGSNGFCIFNNVAIGAAYAMTQYRNQGIQKVAILDLDVHHGNGTQQCVINTSPQDINIEQEHVFGETQFKYTFYKPWLDTNDNQNIFFASTQAFGLSEPHLPGSYFYPASGETWDNKQELVNANLEINDNLDACYPVSLYNKIKEQEIEDFKKEKSLQEASSQVSYDSKKSVTYSKQTQSSQKTSETVKDKNGEKISSKSQQSPQTSKDSRKVGPKIEFKEQNLTVNIKGNQNTKTEDQLSTLLDENIVEDPDGEFVNKEGNKIPKGVPRIINVGIPGPGPQVNVWKRAWRDKILPALASFSPDLIFISAGFDAHKKDTINQCFVGLTEKDYEWLTDQIVQVANRCCEGRIVSALEGGYAIEGCITSPLARSVAAHVQCLQDNNLQKWDQKEANIERKSERLQKILKEKQEANYSMKLQQEQSHLKDPKIHTESFDIISKQNIVDGPRKRRQGIIDYTQLNQQLEQEKKLKK